MPKDQTEQRVVHGLEAVGRPLRGGVLTIGNFDGVHRGHRAILQTARSLADAEGRPVTALTFEPPPDLVARPSDEPRRLTPAAQKCALLLEAGADCVVVAATTRELLAMTPRAFIAEVVVGRFAARHVVEGRNFFFGHARQGTVETLRQASAANGYVCHVVAPVMAELPAGPTRVSSTLIRRLVAGGEVADAARCLGRDFVLYGTVVAGRGHGRVLEFPTANLEPGEQVVPADGVYAGRAEVGGTNFAAAISVGRKPTFGPGERTIEAYLVGAAGDYYGRAMALSFAARLRDQRTFADADSLRGQIAKDVVRVREICG